MASEKILTLFVHWLNKNVNQSNKMNRKIDKKLTNY